MGFRLALLLLLVSSIACAQSYTPPGTFAPIKRTSISVTDLGAKCDGVTDDTAALSGVWTNPLVSLGMTVTIPAPVVAEPVAGTPTPSAAGVGCVYHTGGAAGGPMHVQNFTLKGLGQGAAIRCVDDPGGSQFHQCIVSGDSGINDLGNPITSIEDLTLYVVTPSATNDALWIWSGNNSYYHDLVIQNAGRDCVTVKPFFDNGWVESLHLDGIRCATSGRDSFHFEVDDGFSNVFITQTLITNSTSRLPGRYAVELASFNQAGNYKISSWTWIGGELSCSNSSSPSVADCAHITQASNQNPVEAIKFQGVSIEDDVFAAHTGYAVGVTKTGSAAVIDIEVGPSVIYYGEANGPLDISHLSSWYINACADGVTAYCHGQNSLQIQAEGGLSFSNLTTHTGANTTTLTNSPCAAVAAQDWIAVTVNGVAGYIPWCHP